MFQMTYTKFTFHSCTHFFYSKKWFEIFVLMFYPSKGAANADPEWGPIDFTYVLIILSCVLETYLGVSKWEILVKSGLLVYFLLKKMIRDICTKGRAQHLTDLLMYFWSNKKTKNMTKKCDISRRKFKNIESQNGSKAII